MNYNNFEPEPKRKSPFLPLIFAAVLVVGVFIGYLFSFRVVPNQAVKGGVGGIESGQKMGSVIDFIYNKYVDTINKGELEEKALTALLHTLDPHSDYIPASEFAQANESLQGDFEGIGVEFNNFNDTIIVVNPISGGPSEKAGVMAGDKIIKVMDVKVAGVKIQNKEIFKLLRGKKGTSVKISVKRNNFTNLIDLEITRGKIPIYSIDLSYIISPTIGYIKISRFAITTHNEFITAYEKLEKQGMKKIILDLRGNPGGVLPAAIDICDEFLAKGYTIVYTKGNANPKKIFKSTNVGALENVPVVILIDEGSASASEIVAGALQDNDRAIVIGRRSFGKGLVQEQLDLEDGSAIRLTIARYYTATGRCIQKPYSDDKDAYYAEEYDRYTSGELVNKDSIKFSDSLKFRTPAGKIVYGGGGIMPDYFVGLDTTSRSTYFNKVLTSGLLSSFAFSYADKNRKELNSFQTGKNFVKGFIVSNKLFQEFISFLDENGVKKDEWGISRSALNLKLQLKAYIGRNIYNNEGFYPVMHEKDRTIEKAIEVITLIK